MNENICIGPHSIGPNYPPYIVAEMSGNHNHSLDKAIAIIDAAKQAGAHAVKLQTYTADSLTIDCGSEDFIINDPSSLWCGKNLYNLYQEAHTPFEWHKPLFDHCKKREITVFSTPFDETALELLEDLNAPAYKIASFESNHLPLIEQVAKTRKPLIISTGMANLEELEDLMGLLRRLGHDKVILLKCTSSYPASPMDSNLRTIPHLSAMFDVQVGLSDHTMGIGAPIAAVTLGATFIEKHFTLDRKAGGVDAAFSLEPEELQSLVIETHRAWESLGKITYGGTPNEEKSKQFKRSIYATKDIQKGEAFTRENVKVIRPGYGLAPKYLGRVLTSVATKSKRRGEAIGFGDLG